MDFVENKYLGLIAAAVIQQLSHTPELETRNRKPLAPPATFGATWELRFGGKNSFRVFYNIDKANNVVTVLAHSPRFQAMLAKSRRSMKAGNVIPHNEFWKTVASRQKAKRASSKHK